MAAVSLQHQAKGQAQGKPSSGKIMFTVLLCFSLKKIILSILLLNCLIFLTFKIFWFTFLLIEKLNSYKFYIEYFMHRIYYFHYYIVNVFYII